MEKIFKYNLAGKELEVSIGKVAEQASGSCLVKYGETVVLVTATASEEPREGIDFFPLSVDYEEKLYAVGKIPGGFIKREGKPSDSAILTARLIDRPIRPLFPEGYRNDVQVIATVLSVEQDYSPEIVAMIGSSIALTISDIPFDGPTGSVMVGRIDGEFILNPNSEQREKSDLDLTVSGTEDAIMMVEAGCKEITEDVMLDAILYAHDEIKNICKFVDKIKKEVGKEKEEFIAPEVNEELRDKIIEFAEEDIKIAIRTEEKKERESAINEIKDKTIENFLNEEEDNLKDIKSILSNIEKDEVRNMILKDNIRPDHRKPEEIRPITSEVGLLPRAHGSGLFTRGQTQVLTAATLGATADEQIIDGLGEEESKRYMHHYNFPPYCVGDTRPMRGPGRREIGHGALAERALDPVIPSEEEFPYTIRLVSEVLSSNGSSSQASICGSTLALLDAGVPIKSPVAGIAMGLIKSDEDDKIVILSDILGLEDHLGDMDFKIAGTKDGITAVQMDIKIDGIEREVLEEALERARQGRLHILNKMNEVISEPREELSKYAPKIISFKIDPEKIGNVIGPGGKIINKIIDETGVTIDIEDDGQVSIASEDQESGNRAKEIIEDLVKEVEVGKVYTGKVTKVTNFGAFIDVLNGKEGLLHISNIAWERTNKVEDVLKQGDEVEVKVTDIDDRGRINLSRKALLPKPDKNQDRK